MSTGIHQPLRQMRLQAGLSLREVARRAGMHAGRLSLMERGLFISTKPGEVDALVRVLSEALREQRP